MMTIVSKKNFIALGIFCFVFIVLGIPFTHWWFYGADDFHAFFLAYQTKTWKQLLYFFYEGNAGQGHTGPTNFTPSLVRTNFLGTYYRPFYLIFHALQYWIFGTYAYLYFLISVFFHSLNTALLFSIFTFLAPTLPSAIASLMFAFHPQIAFRFGNLTNQHYYISIFFMLMCITFFTHYFRKNQLTYLIPSAIFYILSLFTRETTIVFPAIAFLIAFALEWPTNKNILSTFWISFKKTLTFSLISLSFLSLRLWLYPLKIHKVSSTSKTFKQYITTKFPELKVFILDFFSLSWLPWNQPILRGFIMLSLIGLCTYLFHRNKKKLLVITLFISGLFMLWPSIPNPYSPRYFYEAHGFFLAGQLLLIYQPSIQLPQWLTKTLQILACFITLTYAAFCYTNFRIRETKMHTLEQATLKLVGNPLIKNQALCFIGHSADGLGDTCAQIFWVLFDNPKLPVYFDRTTAWTQADSNLVIPKKYYIITAPHHTENYVVTTPLKNGFQFTTTNPAKINFGNLEDNGYSLGEKIVHTGEKINDKLVVTDFTLLIDHKYLKNNPIFIQWDYSKRGWIVINQN